MSSYTPKTQNESLVGPKIPEKHEEQLRLHQVVGLAFMYRQLWNVSSRFVLVLSVSPFLWTKIYDILSFATGGNAGLSLCATVALYQAALHFIDKLSTSKKAREASLRQNRVQLPLMCLVAGCVLSIYVLGPILNFVGLKGLWSSTLGGVFAAYFRFSLSSSIRLAKALAILELAVLVRYIAPKSIMRCSFVPLRINPADEIIRKLWNDPLSIIEPGDQPGQLLTAPTSPTAMRQKQQQLLGRRFQHSTWLVMIAQLVLAIVIGLVVAIFVDIVPSNGGDFDKLAIASASVLTLVFSLLPSLDLWSHELDPNLCDNELWPKFYTFLPNMIRQSLMVALVATCLSLAYASFSFGGLDGMHSKLFWTLLISCTCALSFMALLDEAFRVSVFGSCNNLMSLIEELQGDALPLTRLDVIMHSLLVDSMLVSEVVKPTTYLAGLTVEPDEHELRRVTDLWIRFAQTILSPSTLELPFAEDVLRIQLLALLSNNRMTTGKESKPKMFDWVQFDAAVGKEPLSVPFVRSLCIFVGGMGQALVLCKGSNLWAPNRSSVDEWILPPGFFVCAEWAMNSIAIAITSSTAPGGRPLADWKSTQLSILVPAALSSIHNFHRALSKFAEGPLSVRDRSVGKLLSVCDKAATRILSNLKLPRGVGDTNLHLNEECQLWIEGLVDAPALQKESGISQASRPLLLKAK